MIPRFSIFKQRAPRSFQYKPMYAKDESETESTEAGAHIRQTYGGISKKSMREKMDERRYYSPYDVGKAQKKLFYLLAVLVAILLWIFVF